jgi:CHAT domain-containing protein
MATKNVSVGSKAGSLALLALLLPALARAAGETPLPDPGAFVERALSGGEEHQYSIRLERGQFLRLAVEQRGIDVVTILSDSSGREILFVDTHLGVFGTETLCFVSDRSDQYRISIKAFDPEVVPGVYELRVLALGPAAALDRTRAQACLASHLAQVEDRAATAASFAQAMQLYQESARLWGDAGEPRERGVALYAYAIDLRSQGNIRKARDVYLDILTISRASGDRQLEAKTLGSMAWATSFLGDPEAALSLADSATPISRSIGDRQNQADLLQVKGSSLYWLGRYQEALDCGRQGLELAEGIHDRTAQAWAWRLIGESYSALGDSVRSLRAFDKASDLFRATQNAQGLTLTLESAGFLCWQIGAYRRALTLYEESLSIAVKAGHRPGEALARNNIGLVRLSMGELESARAELERALPLWRSSDLAHGEALSLHNLGKVYELEGRPESAALYGQALKLFRRTAEPSGEARVLASIAQAEQKAGHLEEALARIEESLAIFDSLGRQLGSPNLRSSFLALRQNAYTIAVGILADLDASRPGRGFAARAFQASERARARTLIESLTEARLDVAGDLPEELRQRESELSARLNRLQKERASEDRIAGAEEEWDQLIAEIRKRDPRYASLRYPDPISWEEVQTLLDGETAVVSFVATTGRILVFRATSSGIEVHPLAVSPEDLEEKVENYVGLISQDERNRWGQLARRLAADVADPWLAGLSGKTRRLVIVPDGALHSLPFESLPEARTGEPLVERFTISYAPSVTALAALHAEPLRREPETKPAAVFALGNPPIGKTPAGVVSDGESFDLQSLPFAVSEAKSIFRFGRPGSEIWLGADASERRIKGRDLRRFGVLHFATHALLSSRVPTRSALLLAPEGAEDGFLQAREIYRMRLASELVTLSACGTARGQILPGEGVQGLAQAFFHAGTRSVVASLWNVGDRRTAELMKAFYGHLAEGASKADALRQAKLDLLRREPTLAPRYWASFVLLGDGDGRVTLVRERPSLLRNLALLVLAAGLLAVGSCAVRSYASKSLRVRSA